jgi:hypothetical protein
MAELASDSLAASSSVTDAVSIIGVVLAADQSGATLKFSQISKLISRLRMIDVNFGDMFGKFLDGLGQAFDGESKGESEEETLRKYKLRKKTIQLISTGKKGKFDLYG